MKCKEEIEKLATKHTDVSDSLLLLAKKSLDYWKRRYETAYYNWDKENCISHINRVENEIRSLCNDANEQDFIGGSKS